MSWEIVFTKDKKGGPQYKTMRRVGKDKADVNLIKKPGVDEWVLPVFTGQNDMLLKMAQLHGAYRRMRREALLLSIIAAASIAMNVILIMLRHVQFGGH